MLVTALSAGLVALALLQAPYAAAFVRALRRRPPPPPDDPDCPPALVVLSLRGTDPTLPRCLRGLLEQDYPRFDVRVVVDSRDDPAWGVVEGVLEDHPASNVRVEELRHRRETCSLKCSSLVQAVTDLDPAYGFVAEIDADVVPHPTWLREMAAGFEDPSVGVVTGNRWYAPRRGTWGGLVRWLWNVAAVPQMHAYGIPWGGTLAVRAELLESGGVRERWARGYSSDTALVPALREAGRRVRFLPSLLMVDRGACALGELGAWVRRQLICVRVHHPAWPAVVAHGLLTSVALLLVLGAGGAALLRGDAPAAGLALAAIGGYQALLIGAALLLDRAVRSRPGRSGAAPGWLTPAILLRCVAALPLAQALHARALWSAARARSVWWRGVRYDLEGEGQVRMVGEPELQGVGGG